MNEPSLSQRETGRPGIRPERTACHPFHLPGRENQLYRNRPQSAEATAFTANYKSVLLSSASSIILVHNHPSSDPAPSREDLEITRRLKEGADLLGIRLLDHIIIGDGCLSFAERDLL